MRLNLEMSKGRWNCKLYVDHKNSPSRRGSVPHPLPGLKKGRGDKKTPVTPWVRDRWACPNRLLLILGIDWGNLWKYNSATRIIKCRHPGLGLGPQPWAMRNDWGIPHNSVSCTGKNHYTCLSWFYQEGQVWWLCLLWWNIRQCDGFVKRIRCAVFIILGRKHLGGGAVPAP